MEQTFIVHPMSQRFTLKPGETYKGTITVVNPVDATQDFKYTTEVTPYGVIGEDYSADLRTETGRTQIKDWIKIEEPTGTIKPNESKKIHFTITVPSAAEPGGQYATIAVSASLENTENQGFGVDSILELASIVYGYVDGKIVHKGDILENYIPGFSATTPVEVTSLLKNEGNVHEDATYSLSVVNAITGEVIFPTGDEKGTYTELIMPESTRHVVRSISNLPYVGVVKISQSIYYNGHYSAEENNLIICPIWLLFLIFLVISTIVTLICAKIRSIFKKKKAKKKAQAENGAQ